MGERISAAGSKAAFKCHNHLSQDHGSAFAWINVILDLGQHQDYSVIEFSVCTSDLHVVKIN